MKLYIERQNHLVVCKLRLTDKWFFTACYVGAVQLIGRRLEKNEIVEFDMVAKNVKTVTSKRRKK